MSNLRSSNRVRRKAIAAQVEARARSASQDAYLRAQFGHLPHFPYDRPISEVIALEMERPPFDTPEFERWRIEKSKRGLEEYEAGRYKSPEQALSDSGLAEMGPSSAGTFHIPENTDSPELEEFKRAFADKLAEVCKACDRLEQELDKLLEALEPR